MSLAKRLSFAVSALAVCALLTGINAPPAAKTAFEEANTAITAQDWDEAMTQILNALTLKQEKKYVDLLKSIAPNFFRIHEEQAKANLSPEKIPLMEEQCKLMRETVKRIEGLGLTEGRGKKSKPMAIAKPSDEMLGLCEAAPQECARLKYSEGLDSVAAGDYRKAAIAFRESQICVPNFEDASAKYSECRAKAARKVGVLSGSTGNNTYRQLADIVAGAVVKPPTGSDFRQSVALDFFDFIDVETFRSQIKGTGAEIKGSASEIAKKAKKTGADFMLAIDLGAVSKNFTGPTTKRVFLNNEQTLAADVSENSGVVIMDATYQLIEIKTGAITKSGSVHVEDKDIHEWAEVGWTDTAQNTSSQGKTPLQIILEAAAEGAGRGLQEATALSQNPEIKRLTKQKPGTPLGEMQLATRAAGKVAEKIKAEIKDAI